MSLPRRPAYRVRLYAAPSARALATSAGLTLVTHAALPRGSRALDIVLVVRGDREVSCIGASHLAGVVVAGAAVLVRTGWDRHWRTAAYRSGHPHLDGAAARCLVDGGACLVGIDSLNIDVTDTGDRPVHGTLLAHGIPIVEHLCHLGQVPESGVRFHAAPVAVRGMGTFPVRAWALA